MAAETTFLDVNIFMYAAGVPHPYKDPCVRILSDVETGVLVAAINTEILQELLYRYSHIKLADKGVQLCRGILEYPLTILPVTKADNSAKSFTLAAAAPPATRSTMCRARAECIDRGHFAISY